MHAQTYSSKNFQKDRNPEQFGNKNSHLAVTSLFSGTIPEANNDSYPVPNVDDELSFLPLSVQNQSLR